MPASPIPLFDTYNRFRDLNFSRVSDELPYCNSVPFLLPVRAKGSRWFLAEGRSHAPADATGEWNRSVVAT